MHQSLFFYCNSKNWRGIFVERKEDEDDWNTQRLDWIDEETIEFVNTMDHNYKSSLVLKKY